MPTPSNHHCYAHIIHTSADNVISMCEMGISIKPNINLNREESSDQVTLTGADSAQEYYSGSNNTNIVHGLHNLAHEEDP